jgi:(p)ppGpp synthase/HD superfamily hydrolase
MSSLEDAVSIAAEAHKGQTDKGGHPYILHPMRVALSVDTVEAKIVALLHDVVEDNKGWTPERLRARGFSAEVLEALDLLTKSDDDYDSYLRRIKANALARKVKLADLKDNLDLSRIPEPSDEDLKRRKKYLRAVEILEERC